MNMFTNSAFADKLDAILTEMKGVPATESRKLE